MTIMYKLTTQDKTTRGGMKWEIGKTNKATGEGTTMCTDQVLHCYASPHQAVFLNPMHANINNPRLFMIECSDLVATDGLKHASKSQTPVKELPLPILTTNQRVAISIKLALTVYKAVAFVKWANDWLNGTDRTADAYAAYASAAADAYAASSSAAAADAARAAYAASSSDASAAAADAAAYAASSSYAAYASADASAAYAAHAAHAAEFSTAFKEIVEWVLENIT